MEKRIGKRNKKIIKIKQKENEVLKEISEELKRVS